jgi:RNase P subunit RPR2
MMTIQKIKPVGLYQTRQECPYCHLPSPYKLWTETGYDSQHKKYYILVCHNCGYIQQSRLKGGKGE